MKRFLPFIIACITASMSFAQTPTYYNSNAATGSNTFPLGSSTTRKVQFRVTANSISGVGPGNNITVVYFQTANASTSTYPLLNISLKQNTGGFTGGGNFETGMTSVYSGTNVTITSVVNGWVSFTLAVPFLYDPNQQLLVEIEHNSPSAANANTNIRQSNFGGPGDGRQWGDFGQANYTSSDGNTVHFGIDVIPATPCTAAPPSNSLNPVSFTTCPSLPNPSLALANTYSFGGITYQWYSSSASGVGPFSAVAGATLSSMPVPTLATTTWYQLVATCTNVANATTTIAPVAQASVVLTNIVDTPPYMEDFEGVIFGDRLPNCSWLSPQIGSSARTFTAAGPNNLIPRSGQKFAAFENSPPGTSYFFTNGLSLTAGVTYSASVWYATDLAASINWSDLSLLLGASQSATGLVPIASTNGPATSIVYKSLGNTFSVPSTGIYYLAIRATGGAGGAANLVWDDLSVTIPCSLNTPTLTITASKTLACQDEEITLSATGADNLDWGPLGTGPVVTTKMVYSGNFTLTGFNTAAGCTATASQYIDVRPSPQISVLMTPSIACSGAPLYLSATGAQSYTWTTGSNNSAIIDHPESSGSYTVFGTNQYNCQASSVAHVVVQPLPALLVEVPGSVCAGESVQLSAQGANTFKWMANNIFITGNPVTVSPHSSVNYTVEGTDANGCTGRTVISLVVDACAGLDENAAYGATAVFPNPATDHVTIRQPAKSAYVTICDVSGRILIGVEVQKGDSQLDMSALPAGVFYATVKSEGLLQTFKLLKY